MWCGLVSQTVRCCLYIETLVQVNQPKSNVLEVLVSSFVVEHLTAFLFYYVVFTTDWNWWIVCIRLFRWHSDLLGVVFSLAGGSTCLEWEWWDYLFKIPVVFYMLKLVHSGFLLSSIISVIQLSILTITVFVETLNKCFREVCEIDIVFNFNKVPFFSLTKVLQLSSMPV